MINIKNEARAKRPLDGRKCKHNKTGKIAIIIKQDGPFSWSYLTIKHDNGRITKKQRHYFDYDYTLITESEG